MYSLISMTCHWVQLRVRLLDTPPRSHLCSAVVWAVMGMGTKPYRGGRDGENMPERKVSNNNVQRLREDQLLSKAELARRAGVSVLTIDRVERGESCRLDTKRKIILALGMKVSEKEQVFEDANKKK